MPIEGNPRAVLSARGCAGAQPAQGSSRAERPRAGEPRGRARREPLCGRRGALAGAKQVLTGGPGLGLAPQPAPSSPCPQLSLPCLSDTRPGAANARGRGQQPSRGCKQRRAGVPRGQQTAPPPSARKGRVCRTGNASEERCLLIGRSGIGRNTGGCPNTESDQDVSPSVAFDSDFPEPGGYKRCAPLARAP